MKFSASSLSTLTTCGYKYELEKVHGLKEPGRKGFSMLAGKIMEDAVQAACLQLNQDKVLSVPDLERHLVESLRSNLEEAALADIDCLIEPVKDLLSNGLSPDSLAAVDSVMDMLNSGPTYEFKIPKINKDGSWSRSKSSPTLSMWVTGFMENLIWFFSPTNPYLDFVRDATNIEIEKHFQIPIGEPYLTTINGVEVEEQDYIDGYYDLMIHHPDQRFIFELKYVNTPYTDEFVDVSIQQLTYHMSCPDTKVVTFDLKNNGIYVTEPDQTRIDLHTRRFLMARGIIRDRLFVPACGTNPWATNNMLCGFKDSCQCPYAPGYQKETVEEEVYA